MRSRLSVLIIILFGLLLLPSSAFAQEPPDFSSLESSPLLLPPNLDAPTEVLVGVYVLQITELNETAETFSVEAILELSWQDDRHQFNPEDVGTELRTFTGVEVLRLLELGLLWMPDLHILTVQGERLIEDRDVKIHADGRIVSQERFHAEIQIPQIDFHRMPFDNQPLQIPLESLSLDSGIIQLLPNNDLMGYGDALGIEDWDITGFSVNVAERQPVWMDAPVSTLTFEMTAERQNAHFFFAIGIPMLVILIVAWSTLFLSDHNLRIDMMVAALLMFVAFNFTITDELPPIDYMTFIDAIIAAAYVTTGAAVVVNLYSRYLHERGHDERSKLVNRLSIIIVPSAYMALVAISVVYFLF